uniref:Gamma carbonic anhydrase n=3 Tax=Ditylum brightwellii TaxID=49249 RepID=A0A7S4QM24_9STRA
MASGIGSRVVVAASNAARRMGLALDGMGASMEVAKYTERLVPSTRFVAVDGVAPAVSESAAFVAPSASVIGNVSLGSKSSIWYGATVRGDVNHVVIGDNSSIGDRAVIHVAKIQGDSPTVIGNNDTIGPGAIVHAATLGDSCVVGASAQVLDGATVQEGAYVAPGAVVTPGTTVPAGQYWAGSPAKMVRSLSDEELATIVNSANETTQLASLHAGECAKDLAQLVADEEKYLDDLERDPEYFQPTGVDEDDVLGQGQPGRIFNTTLSHPEEGLKRKQNQ